jgi:hypothetical protein
VAGGFRFAEKFLESKKILYERKIIGIISIFAFIGLTF